MIKYWVITRKDKNHIDWLFHFLESDAENHRLVKTKVRALKVR